MSYSKMRFIVGFFMISVLFLFSTFVYIVLKEKGTFDKHYTYHFTTHSADYFHTGMPLKFSGFKIGEIDSITLKDDGSVDMIFSVKEKNTKWLSEGSILMLMKPLIGSSHVELFTALGEQKLENGSYMTIVMSDSINDLVVKLKPAVKKLDDILSNVHTITTYLSSEDSELIKILQNLEKLTAKLANDDSLLTSATGDKEATQAIIKSIKESAKIMEDLSKITSSLNKEIVHPASSSVKELNLILKDIKQKLSDLDPTVKAVGGYDKELVEIKEQISVGLQKSNQIMDKVDAIMQDEKQSEVTLP